MSDLSFLLDGRSEIEKAARIATLRALCMVCAGQHHPASRALDAAVLDPARIGDALDAIDRLPALQRRKLLANFGALHTRARSPRRRRTEESEP